jgi:hypothetical protein
MKLKIAAALLLLAKLATAQQSEPIQFIFSSDAHFGITREAFRGENAVPGDKVNAAMVSQTNTLPALTLPTDGGLKQGQKIGYVDYVIETGDIANREETPIQSAATSWAQFSKVYLAGIKLKGSNGKPAGFLLVPGNHDISNAIGFYKPMQPLTDATSIAEIYNLGLKPKTPLTAATYDYNKDKVNYSRDIKGIHFMFITLWPDSAERIWMEKDLLNVAKTTPVVIFTHDQPECEAKHFTNPVPPYDINANAKFENLVMEHYKEGTNAKGDDATTLIEQRGWVKFLKAHPNIKAYFHGNSNWNQFYTYHGPDNDVSLNMFRADSPMKGKYSSKDETKLSFQFVIIDPVKMEITSRECLWNTMPAKADQPVVWGEMKTVSLK